MKLSRRTNTIILWIIAIGLLVGMIITFTPTLGFDQMGRERGRTALLVDGEAVTELEVARTRQNPLFNTVREGEVGADLELLLVDQMVRQKLFDQAASRTRVSDREVNAEVRRFREAQGVAGRRNDDAYLRLIGQSGFDDQSFRAYVREQLRRAKYEESISEDVEVSDEELETYYLANADDYRSEDRIVGRMIVVEDVALAQELRERAEAGEDFAELAREHSAERADRAGALGAPRGSDEPQPVGRAALPQAVAEAAFALRGGGITDVVEAGGRAYIVQVEEYRAQEARPLAEIEDQVREDALAAKRAGILQRHIEELREQATIEIPENSELEYDDYPVARVGDEEIMASELARATYTNQQIQQNLNAQFAPLIVDFFKPAILDNMIERKLAYLGAERLDGAFVGTEAEIGEQALALVSRDASIDERSVEEYYEANARNFTVPARATVTRVEFESQQAAEAFRQDLLDGVELAAAADERGGEVLGLGNVGEGDLEEALDRAVFGTDAFEPLPASDEEVSDVLVLAASRGEEPAEAEDEVEEEPDASASDEIYVVLLAERTAERVMPLDEVRGQVEEAVLASERNSLRQAWVAGLREEIEVENYLAEARSQRQDVDDDQFGVDGAALDDLELDGVEIDVVEEDAPEADPGAVD